MKLSLSSLKWKKDSRLLEFGKSTSADWKIILASTLVLSILIIALSIYMFIKIDKREVFVIEKSEDTGDKNLNLSILKDTVFYYQNKGLEFERIKDEGI